MGKLNLRVKVNSAGKYVFDTDKVMDITKCTRVALRNDSYVLLHNILSTKVDPLVSLMKVEEVPDSTYDMVGGLDKQIWAIKEVTELPIQHSKFFDALGVAQPKGVLLYGSTDTGKMFFACGVVRDTDRTFIRVWGAEYIAEDSRMVSELSSCMTRGASRRASRQ